MTADEVARLDKRMQHLRGMLCDALRHASGIAARSQEIMDGTDGALLFEACRMAIVDFTESNAAMKALASAVVRRS